MWFKNIRAFRLSPNADITADLLTAALQKAAHRPLGASEMHCMGWVPPHESCGLVHSQDGQLLIRLRTERKLLPASVVNQAARERAREIEGQQGYKPGRKQMKDIKEQITDELLPKSHSVERDTWAWIDTKNHWLVVGSATHSAVDELLGMLAKALEPFPVLPLHVAQAPATAMTDWLVGGDAPPNFSIDQDAELRSTSENRAAVRYVRQHLDVEEIRRHVRSGKQCTRLALTWNDRVSFVLTEGLDIKRIAPLDILNEGRMPAADEAEQFDSDMLLMTRELALLMDDVVAALGGEKYPF